MKHLLLIFAMVLMGVATVMAQRTVSGTVTDDTGAPMPFANVFVEGTTVGTTTDIDGNYNLKVPEGATTLMVSYTGYADMSLDLTDSSTLDFAISEGVTLDNVVVTALGITREEKSLGYSVQEVDGDVLNMARDNNVVSSLSGKVAGVQVISSSGASLGGNANIKIRGGTSSLSGGQPLFVVDGTPISNRVFDDQTNSDEHRGVDYGNLAQDINPDDIETVSVLKGPAATALYGQRASGGAIMITTKKGKARKGIGVTINSSITFDNVYVLPEYQNEYAGGYTQNFIPYTPMGSALLNDGSGGYLNLDSTAYTGEVHNTLNYAADESWGPKIDGQMYRPWWSWYEGTPEYGQEIPLESNPDNVRNFFDTGMTFNNGFSMTGGDEKTSFRFSYNNLRQTGVVPNSELTKHNVGINASNKMMDKLTLSTSLNYVNTTGSGRPTYGYLGNNAVLSFNQWFQRQLDMDRLRDYQNPDGSYRSWNIRSPTNLRPLYWDSPFFSIYENLSTDNRDRYFGNVTLNYEIMDGLSAQVAVRRDFYSQRIDKRTASGGLDLDQYAEIVENAGENNFDGLLTYGKNFGDISFDANLGGTIRKNNRRYNFMQTEGGLNAPNLFNIGASTDRPTNQTGLYNKTVRSVYAAANLGFKSMLYVGATVRNDWSSALPADNNSYLYPSISTSFVFSELFNSNAVSFGKLRANWAQVGSDIDEYATNLTYDYGTPYGSSSSFAVPNVLPNQNIRPANTSSYEVGLDMRFVNDRVGFDVTYYNQDAKDQILLLDVPSASGYTQAYVNAGHINSNGLELTLYATPVKSDAFTWDITFNAATNNSIVKELADGLDNYLIDSWGWGGLSINAPVDGEWGTFRGTGFATDDSGNRIIDEDGYYELEPNKDLGGVLPDWTGGVRNTFNFKGFQVGAFIDWQKGGQFHSVTKMFNAYSGLSSETVGDNGQGGLIRQDGVHVEGVLADGTPYSTLMEAQNYYSGNLFGLNENWIYDASYVKLRELSVGYNIPSKLLGDLPIQNANLSLIGRNLWLIHSNVDGIDPSEITPGTNGLVFQENGILPGVRSFGVNLKIGF